jgi:hypothetical protein
VCTVERKKTPYLTAEDHTRKGERARMCVCVSVCVREGDEEEDEELNKRRREDDVTTLFQ